MSVSSLRQRPANYDLVARVGNDEQVGQAVCLTPAANARTEKRGGEDDRGRREKCENRRQVDSNSSVFSGALCGWLRVACCRRVSSNRNQGHGRGSTRKRGERERERAATRSETQKRRIGAFTDESRHLDFQQARQSCFILRREAMPRQAVHGAEEAKRDEARNIGGFHCVRGCECAFGVCVLFLCVSVCVSVCVCVTLPSHAPTYLCMASVLYSKQRHHVRPAACVFCFLRQISSSLLSSSSLLPLLSLLPCPSPLRLARSVP